MPSHRPAFLLWGWAMLLVVLLCAAPTGGQPRTRVVGSAFDPATVSVVVNPKQPKMSAAAKKAQRRDSPTPLLAVLPALAVLAAPSLPARLEMQAGQAPGVADAPTGSPQRLLTRPLGARAPPRA